MYWLKKTPSEAKIKKFFRRIIFGKNIFCPECKERSVVRYETRYRCRSCRCKFSLISHTWLTNLKIPFRQLWLILWCWTAQIPVKQAMSISGLSKKGVRYWYATFRNHLPKDKVVLEAIIQLDEAYFGGFKGKTLLMAKQKGTRKLAYKILSHEPSKLDALEFLKEYVSPGSMICTDGSAIYRGIDKLYPVKHVVDIHKAREYSRTSEIEGIFGNLRTFIRRMYHHVTIKILDQTVSEFCFRFSHPEMFENPRYYLKNSLSLVPTG